MCNVIRFGLVMGVLLAAGCGRRSGENEQSAAREGPALPKKVVIGYQAIPNAEIVAKDQGWVEEALGVPVEWNQFNSGADVNLAVAGGSVDFGLCGSSPTAVGISRDVGYDVIWIHDVIGDNEALVARVGSGITSVRDLVGKKVAVPFASTTHYHLMVALQVAGVETTAVNILDMPNPDTVAAWQHGDLDAAFVWEPTLTRLQEMGGEVVITSRSLAEQGYLTADIGVVRSDFAAQYPDLVVEYLRAQIRAVAFTRANPDAAAAAVARQFSIPVDQAKAQMQALILLSGEEQAGSDYLGTPARPGALPQVLKGTADFLVEQQSLPDAPPLEAFKAAVKPAYLEQALGD